MKIVFVSDFYHPSIGGTQRLTQTVLEGFLTGGFAVSVITRPDENRKQEDYSYPIYEVEEVDLTKTNAFYEQSFDAAVVFADFFSNHLATFPCSLVSNSVLVLNLDENVYRWIQNNENGYTPEVVQNIVEKIKTFNNFVSFCQGAPVNKFFEEHGIEYTFIPNFSHDVLETEVSDKDIKSVLGIENKIIFNHGLFEDRKNQLGLIKAFNKSSLTDDYTLVFLGSPRFSHAAQSHYDCRVYVEENNLLEKVKFINSTTNRAIIDKLLRVSDVYMLPSKAEGLPLVLIEAMSAGLPWVSTPVGGVPEVFGGLRGGRVLDSVEFSPENLEESVRAVEGIDRRIPREEWEENFAAEIAIQRYNDVIKKESSKNKVYNIHEEKYKLKNTSLKDRLAYFKEINSRLNVQTEKIKLLYKLFEGEKAIIISCGPSLNKQNFEKIKKLSKDHVVISIKQAFNLFKEITDFHIFNCANIVKYDYSKYKPIIIEASSAFNDINKSDIAFKIIERDLNKSLVVQKNFDDWKISKQALTRPFGPGIMYELVFFLVEHMGFSEVLTIGWDNKLINKTSENQHFYQEKDLIIFNDISKINNNYKNLKQEEQLTIKAISDWYKWLQQNGCTLKICSSTNPAPPYIERVIL